MHSRELDDYFTNDNLPIQLSREDRNSVTASYFKKSKSSYNNSVYITSCYNLIMYDNNTKLNAEITSQIDIKGW